MVELGTLSGWDKYLPTMLYTNAMWHDIEIINEPKKNCKRGDVFISEGLSYNGTIMSDKLLLHCTIDFRHVITFTNIPFKRINSC